MLLVAWSGARRFGTCLLVLTLWAGCEHDASSSSPAAPTSTPAVVRMSLDELRERLAALDQQIDADASQSAAYLERGDVHRRLAAQDKADQSTLHYLAAWDDFRRAHELAGGVWKVPELKDALARITEGKSRALKFQEVQGEDARRGSVEALLGAERVAARLYQFDLWAYLTQRAAQVDSKHPRVQIGMIQVQAQSDGKWKQAASKIGKLLEQPEFKDLDSAWFAYAFDNHQAGNAAEAERGYRQAIKLSEEPDAARVNLAGLLDQQGRHKDAENVRKQTMGGMSRLYAVNNEGSHLVHIGHYVEAVALLEPLVQQNPNFPAASINLSNAYAKLGRHKQAIALLEHVTELMPQSGEHWQLLDREYLCVNRPEDAADAHKQALANHRAPALARFSHANALRETGQRAAARDALRDLVKDVPDSMLARTRLGEMQLDDGDVAAARETLGRALKEDAKDLTALADMGGLELRDGHVAEALNWYRKASAAKPDDTGVACRLGCALVRAGQPDEALALVDKGVQEHKDATEWLYCRAQVRLASGNLREALDDLNAIMTREPNVDACTSRAVVNVMLGDRDAALADARQCVEMRPADTTRRLLVWILETERGNNAAADEVLSDIPYAIPAYPWYRQLVAYCRGKLTADELLATAQTNPERCEGYYYVGERVRLHDGPAAARPWFEKCVALGITEYLEHQLAEWRLKQ